MIKENGITLVELIIVISIIGILIVALGFSFQGWVGGYRIEVQAKEMYADLMNARARAMQRKGLIKAPTKEDIKSLNKRKIIHVKGEPVSETVIKLRGEK